MRLGQMVDPVAELLLELQKVSAPQWLLRILGAATTVLALMAALGSVALFAHPGTTLVTLVVVAAVLAQMRNPDSDLGLLAPGAILLAVLVLGEVPMLRAAGAGLALLVAHSAFALAAVLPVHGVLDRSAWLLAGKGLLPVAVVAAVAAVLVIGLATVQLGPWMMVAGVIAAIGLLMAVVPWQR